MQRNSDFPRSWDFSAEPELVGRYREIREVTTADGPRALVELELESGEPVTVWLSAAALKRRFADELKLRARQGASDFDAGERVTIARGTEKRTSVSTGFSYWPYTVTFENAARRTAADLLLGDEPQAGDEHDDEGGPSDAIPF